MRKTGVQNASGIFTDDDPVASERNQHFDCGGKKG